VCVIATLSSIPSCCCRKVFGFARLQLSALGSVINVALMCSCVVREFARIFRGEMQLLECSEGLRQAIVIACNASRGLPITVGTQDNQQAQSVMDPNERLDLRSYPNHLGHVTVVTLTRVFVTLTLLVPLQRPIYSISRSLNVSTKSLSILRESI
jgi:hypothetical protein